MSDRPRDLCVIVLNYFGAERTGRCAQALIGQPLDTLYLVDNSADAGEAEAMRGIAADLKNAGAGFDVRVLEHSRNFGFSQGVNRTLISDRRTGGHRYYLFLNNDALLPARAISGLLQTIREPPAAALVSAQIRSGARSGCWMHYFPGFGHMSFTPSRWAFPFATGACLLVDAAWVGENGLFDDDFFLYGEDVLLSWQVRKRGGRIRCSEEVLVEHAGSASSGQCSLFYEYHIVRGHILLGRKLAGSAWERRRFFIGRAAYLSARALVRALRCRSSAPLSALWAAWWERPPPRPP